MKKIFTLPVILLVCMAFAAVAVASDMQVEKLAVGEDVVNREVVSEGESFPVSVGKLYCLSKIANIPDQTEVIHAWYYGSAERARVKLNISPPAWRTYSSKIIQDHEIGLWRVEILDTDGNLLETVRFQVTQ
ncbi:MAG: DUF2914 domain-containing protein [Deltaproteobacteria bacterium]|jgi:hypothetical protein|nr:DUF2914 domain-containing protein [Deltaproteobacteria bacterium]